MATDLKKTDKELFEIVEGGNYTDPASVREVNEAVEELIEQRGYRIDKIESLNPDYFNNTDVMNIYKEAEAAMESPVQDSNESFAGYLSGIGTATIIIGFLLSFILMAQFDKAGLFSKGEITGTEWLIIIAACFYHLVFGMLCIGVSKALRK